MDKKYLDKVLDQLVSETKITDFDKGHEAYIDAPFRTGGFLTARHMLYSAYWKYCKHCKNVYGLNEEEVLYVWEEYSRIIKDKIFVEYGFTNQY